MKLFRMLMALGLMLSLNSCTYVSSPYLYYKIIVEVESDGKIYSGYSVNMQHFSGPRFWGVRTNFVGAERPAEAVYVDIGNRGTLFALIPTANWTRTGVLSVDLEGVRDFPFYIPIKDWPPAGKVYVEDRFERLVKMQGSGAEIPCLAEDGFDKEGRSGWRASSCPIMVRFGDINVSKTVELVNPKDLAASFGDGVKLRSVRVEITDGPYSQKIHKKLPWLRGTDKLEEVTEDVWDQWLDMGRDEAIERGILTFPMTINAGYFEQGHPDDR